MTISHRGLAEGEPSCDGRREALILPGTGREIERVGAHLPDLRREGLRALAVLGGFVALCAAAVRAIALLL
ncbi:hypothetical protein [Nonomuraea aurantiaca]|uniref:hypothetical protein n=1 Tax=Nonomuraea aurantiaca TaxID=2878562 RepID=UPI001CD99B24|nr:hypothetical protein [Nonomuraea aurantiaca]MCA2229903.1 hypothetical protein [Nonomuraea aurantiaca]